jgi:hypothetical protein
VFGVRLWGGDYKEEPILNITVFVFRLWVVEFSEELILNVTVFVVRIWLRVLQKGNDPESFCVFGTFWEINIERNQN